MAIFAVMLMLGVTPLIAVRDVPAPSDRGPDIAPLPPDADSGVAWLPTMAPAMGCSFVENLGQVDDPEVRFYAQGDPLSAAFTPHGVLFALVGQDDLQPSGPTSCPDSRRDCVRFELGLGQCREVEPVGSKPLDYRTNVFRGRDPGRWVRGAESFEEVLYEGIHNGVDLRFRFEDGMLKYDLLIDAGVDLGQVTLSYRGDADLGLDRLTGELLIITRLGTLRDARPTASVGAEVTGDEVPVRYRLLDGGAFGFVVDGQQMRGYPMVIDPGLRFSTLFGGPGYDQSGRILIDSDGSVIAVGLTKGMGFPTTEGAYDSEGNASIDNDSFVVRFDPSGAPLFCTLISGKGDDWAKDVAVASDGQLVVVGGTGSKDDFPLVDPLYGVYGGGLYDGFMLRLSADGSQLLKSTYVGGSGGDEVSTLCMDDAGRLNVAIRTSSPDMGAPPGAYCTTLVHPLTFLDSVFLASFDGVLTQRMYCTYLNGLTQADVSRHEPAVAISHAIDGAGNVYVASSTDETSTLPGPLAGFCATVKGLSDGLLVKLDPTLSHVMAWTVLGGLYNETVEAIDISWEGHVVVTGDTKSPDFPTTEGAYCRQLRGSLWSDSYLVVLDTDLAHLELGTFFGGQEREWVYALTVDVAGGRAFIGGRTFSVDMPTTEGCVDPIARCQWVYVTSDCFLAGFNLTQGELTYSTYLGGLADQTILSMAMEANGDVLATGITSSEDFPISKGAYCATLHEGEHLLGYDIFLAAVDPSPCAPPSDAPEGLSALPGDGFVALKWVKPPVEGWVQTGYRVYRGTTPGNERLVANVSWKAPEFTDNSTTGLENGVRYLYRVGVLNSAGESPLGDPVWARPMGLPSEPAGLTASTGDRAVHLSWAPPNSTGGELTGYQIWRLGPSDLSITMYANLEGNGTTFDDMLVTPGRPIVYAVCAYNERGPGPLSLRVNVTPLGPPTPPTKVRATPGNGQVTLTWSAPVTDGGSAILAYRVYRGNATGAIAFFGEASAAGMEYIDAQVEPCQSYYYCVTAVSDMGESGPMGWVVATPYGPPSTPRGLSIEAGDGEAHLSWSAPLSDGGRQVRRYLVYFWTSPDDRAQLDVGLVLRRTVTGLTNGVTYMFEVRAENEAGEGDPSDPVSAMPVGPPEAPTGLDARSVPGGIELTWVPPGNTGGGQSIVYQVLRGRGPMEQLQIAETLEGEYLDSDVVVGETYYYWVRASSELGQGAAVGGMAVRACTVPGAVTGLVARRGDGSVNLTWAVPDYDGLSSITGYIVLRGVTASSLSEVARLGLTLTHTDAGLENGRTYHYAVRALNYVGPGEYAAIVNATPLPPPSMPALRAEAREDSIVLRWTASPAQGCAPVTGYRVLRGTDPSDLRELATLGPTLSYTDRDIGRGRIYYYAVEPLSDVGSGERSFVMPLSTASPTGFASVGTMLAVIVLVIVAVLIAVSYILGRARREVAVAAPEDSPPSMEATTLAATTEAVAAGAPDRYTIEEVFVVYRDGRLIADCAHEAEKTRDADLMSGMLIAIQGIVQDGLERGGALESIKYGDNLILLSAGQHVNLAAVVYGQPDEGLSEELKETVRRIEITYAGVIEGWVGDLSVFEGLEALVDPIMARTAHLTRKDIAGITAAKGVTVLSAVDFHRGFVRLKAAAVNSTDVLIADVTFDVHYNPDMLRLERVEPETVKVKGDRATLGNVKPGERVTVAFLFDPQICQSTDIDGHITYYDARGEAHSMEMKRRHAEVVCPIFFTREHANTAMLQRLIRDTLTARDTKVFRYPTELSPEVVLSLGKAAVGDRDVQLVREFAQGGPPFYAEVWYYGETKVKGYQIVLRLGVVEEERALEFFAASTAIEPVTGLLAELRRELDEVMGQEYPAEVRMELERDAGLRGALADRDLLLDLIFEEGKGDGAQNQG